MSLVPYREDSLILDDPHSNSIMILNPSVGSVRFYQQLYSSHLHTNNTSEDNFDIEKVNYFPRQKASRDTFQFNPISTFRCPQCGTEIDPIVRFENVGNNNKPNQKSSNDDFHVDSNTHSKSKATSSHSAYFNLSKQYFNLLESSHKRLRLQEISYKDDELISDISEISSKSPFFIPDDLFIPGYFRKFFNTIDLLGRGARGSVFKVVHKIGSIELGLFALKKIPIGNDSLWFEKCIREVKALNSITHETVNLITYNHVWLEMERSNGLVRTVAGDSISQGEEMIPCLFILQQYCPGGNLEEVIQNKVFQKSNEFTTNAERKKIFKLERARKNSNVTRQLGLSTIQITDIIRNIANGLKELHDLGLIHRDLKPSNCLLVHEYEQNLPDIDPKDSNNEWHFPPIVIGDLGESQVFGESRSATGATGTLEFTAPEVIIPGEVNTNPNFGSIDSYNEYSYSSDIYSLGMILYFIIFGELPFGIDLELPQLKSSIINLKTFDKDSLIKKHVEMNLKPINYNIFNLMLLLISKDPNNRPKASEIDELLDIILQGNKGNHHVSVSHNGDLKDEEGDVSITTESRSKQQRSATSTIQAMPVNNERQMITVNYRIKPAANNISYSTSKSLFKMFKDVSLTSSIILIESSIVYFVTSYSSPNSISQLISCILWGLSIKRSLKIQSLILLLQLAMLLNVFYSDYTQFLLTILHK
ncbi:hypothetical protein TPHA_0I02660 [Tetrapisispora phaffii CBS 4417]|uniref:Protein kinase domain-containing protein n=1 Tax=Tetrapisispora phaffii (strain ATCC 24235 / CBS 4417 / NBRC 1672 / NRRL Y-8282 / UCD 70-5) TaxID=1071381 RepID=G8BXY9_TETPH|nr:hypothetical protein TPHA_0I02660 [Tetrapisispora phaffii CBS 4417]CCE64767.1 hypothetical protein TPHA_0I02660 [Tetrapisispora phaffii CBS 4417]